MQRPDALDLLVDTVAAYRLTKLITDDKITEGPRRKFVEAAYVNAGRASGLRSHIESEDWHGAWDEYAQIDPEPPKLATLVTCRWCMGMWVGIAVVISRRVAPRAWSMAAKALCASAGAALIAGLEE